MVFENFIYEKDFYKLGAFGWDQFIRTGSRKGRGVIKK